MASNLTQPDNREDLLYVKRIKKDQVIYCGYKKTFLSIDLSEMEQKFVICKVCSGIMREASLLQGEIICLVCSESPDHLNTIKIIQESIEILEIKCPLLRDCMWKGKMSEAESHLKTCKYFLMECALCNSIVSRGESERHRTDICPMREVKCEVCSKYGKAKSINEHLEVCPEYPTSCPNKCGKMFPRNTLSQHQSECQLEVITCPYKEYGCNAEPMLRKDLLSHKMDYILQHSDMSLVEVKKLKNENLFLKKKQTEMEWEVKTMKKLEGVEWEIKHVDNLIDGLIKGPEFYVNNYKLRLYLEPFNTWEGWFLHFRIKRVEGEFDMELVESSITNYRIIISNKQDYADSYYSDGAMNYPLMKGTEGGEFCSISFREYKKYLTVEKSVFLRFYFDINTHKSFQPAIPRNSKIHHSKKDDPFEYLFELELDSN